MKCLSTLLVVIASAVLLAIVGANDGRLVRENSKFALHLYKYMAAGHSNFVFSPFSVSSCMAMLYGGVTGNNARELAHIMRFTKLGRSVHRRFKKLVREFRKGNYTLSLANRIFTNRHVPILKKFKHLARAYYGASVKKLDFTNKATESVRYINLWVARKTQQKITGLLSTADVNSDTNLVIVNTLFFRGFWSLPFRRATKATFHLSDSTSVSVDMMSTPRHQFFRAESQEMRCTVFEIPYVADDAKMYILLPTSAADMAWLESHLDYDSLQTALLAMEGWTGTLRLPKFHVTSSYELTNVFRKLGLKSSLNHGNVTLISSSQSDQTNINHKACIDVSEERTDASAATAAITYRNGFLNFGPTVAIDRPFVFIIKHRTGSILFVGRVLDPTARF